MHEALEGILHSILDADKRLTEFMEPSNQVSHELITDPDLTKPILLNGTDSKVAYERLTLLPDGTIRPLGD